MELSYLLSSLTAKYHSIFTINLPYYNPRLKRMRSLTDAHLWGKQGIAFIALRLPRLMSFTLDSKQV